MPDMIEHQHNGYLAQAFDSEDLARGIIWILENQETNRLRYRARQKAEKEFTLELQARRYESLYLERS
jgi:glycosyltransferase involved in cell wall biosynthesis